MTIQEIRELIQFVRDTGIAELEVQWGEDRVRIKGAGGANHDFVIPGAVPVPIAVPAAGQSAIPAGAPVTVAAAPSAPAEEDRHMIVKSPIVGTYYDAPSPGADPFVKVGDRVEPKQVLCIIESMKLMNEIEAETAGTVVAKHVENGRPVEYGESLFTIRPL
ncbi:MAG: acetyl-CoA carboxylase biotin carboxyl carrier protein [Acidobacteriaceae bacterium]|nr:acetyl-CoA carboxylase biotin carboxyl carrier protein [Acidobacteriaceae bacterium]